MKAGAFSCRSALAAAVVAISIRGGATAPQFGQLNTAPAGPRTGMIVGQVVDATGAPVPEAIIRLSMPRYLESLATTPKGRVMADAEGRFFFADLPAGDYYLYATKDGYESGSYGQRSARSSEGQLFALSEGERRTDARLTVWKYAAIAGTVVDEAGEPVVGIGVRALIKDVAGGRTRFGSPQGLFRPYPTAFTDDRGRFRLSQLVPGTYVVQVPSAQTTLPVAVLEATQDATLRNALFLGGIVETAPLGQPRTVQVGDFAMMTLSRVLVPPAPTPDGRAQIYKATYFPSASSPGTASQVTLQSGEERADLTITLRPVPAVQISGRLVAPDGSVPPVTTLRLVGESAGDVLDSERPSGSGGATAFFETALAMSDASGRFMLLGVPPGEYVLKHANPFLILTARQGRPAYWVSQRITVGTRDIDDLVLQLQPALRVEGRIVLPDVTSGQPPVPPIVGRGAIFFETPFGEPGRFSAEGNGDAARTFATVGAAGQYFVRPVETGGWAVQSITVDGKDFTDRAIDLQSDITSMVVTYTERVSKVSGTVRDARGEVSPTAIVVAFPVDRERWVGYGLNPRTSQSALTSRAGVYTFAHLPTGDYFVVAIDGAHIDGWRDPKTLEALATVATKLTIAAGDATAKTLDLTVRTVR